MKHKVKKKLPRWAQEELRATAKQEREAEKMGLDDLSTGGRLPPPKDMEVLRIFDDINKLSFSAVCRAESGKLQCAVSATLQQCAVLVQCLRRCFIDVCSAGDSALQCTAGYALKKTFKIPL
jgi:hypothetical protein